MSADGDTLAAMRKMLGHLGPPDDDIVLWRMSTATGDALAASVRAVIRDPGRGSQAWRVPVDFVDAMPNGYVVGVTRAQRRDELATRLRREQGALRTMRRLFDGSG